MKKQLLSEELNRMKQLAGLINESESKINLKGMKVGDTIKISSPQDLAPFNLRLHNTGQAVSDLPELKGMTFDYNGSSITRINESEDRFSEYSNDALADMIINLSRYEDTEDDIQTVKDELARRKGDSAVNENAIEDKAEEVVDHTNNIDDLESGIEMLLAKMKQDPSISAELAQAAKELNEEDDKQGFMNILKKVGLPTASAAAVATLLLATLGAAPAILATAGAGAIASGVLIAALEAIREKKGDSEEPDNQSEYPY